MPCTSTNGRLPKELLASIKGGVALRKDAALAWNAMSDEIYEKAGYRIQTNGPDSSYRVISRQYYWRNWWCSRGSCGNAATPGCSNHGEGLSVDVNRRSRQLIDKYGAKYGWAKKWSDAQHEWWHLTWRKGVWTPPPVDPFAKLTTSERQACQLVINARAKLGRIRALANRSEEEGGGWGSISDPRSRKSRAEELKADIAGYKSEIEHRFIPNIKEAIEDDVVDGNSKAGATAYKNRGDRLAVLRQVYGS